MLAILDPRLWLVGIGALAIAYGGGRYQQYSHDKTVYATKAQAALVVATQAQEKAVEAARVEEQRRTQAQTEIANDATQQAQAAQADKRAADTVADGLRQRVADLLAAARATSNTATARTSPATSDPLGVLADVLERADRRAGLLAEYADQARIAGLACQRAYDSLTAPAGALIPQAPEAADKP